MVHYYFHDLNEVKISQECCHSTFYNFGTTNTSCQTQWKMVFLKQPHSTTQLALTFPALLAIYSTNLILHSTHNFAKVVYKLLIPLLCIFSIRLLFMSKNYSQHPALKHCHSGKPVYTNVTTHSLPDT